MLPTRLPWTPCKSRVHAILNSKRPNSSKTLHISPYNRASATSNFQATIGFHGHHIQSYHSPSLSLSYSFWDLQKTPSKAPETRKEPSDIKSKPKSKITPKKTNYTKKKQPKYDQKNPKLLKESQPAPVKKSLIPYDRRPIPMPSLPRVDLKMLRKESSEIRIVSEKLSDAISVHQVLRPRKSFRTKIDELRAEERTQKQFNALKMKVLPTVSIDGLNENLSPKKMCIAAGVRPALATDTEQAKRAMLIAQQLELPYFETMGSVRRSSVPIAFMMVVGMHRISLTNLKGGHSPDVYSDFIEGSTAYRQGYVICSNKLAD